MAAKDNVRESDIDKTSFWYGGLCNICHPGGGFGEFDRDGELYYDVRTSQFGYEKLGKTAADVRLDGDYAEINHMSGALRAAPWDITGVAEPDCLFCHRTERAVSDGKNMNWVWRTATLRSKDKLKDTGGASVPAYAAAATAGQGWFSAFALNSKVPAGKPPMATTLDIDYQPGVDNGSLKEDGAGSLRLDGASIVGSPKDYACWGCHLTPDLKKRGRSWFDESSDVHYAGFNNLNDADPTNDIAPGNSTACTQCHPAGLDHNIAKGNATVSSVRNDTDYAGLRTCRDCHLPGAEKHENAPTPTSDIHIDGHLEKMSCEMCHIPYKTRSAVFAIDNATTGNTIGYPAAALLSADPLDPTDPDKSRWYPSFKWKTDKDGERRLFPIKLLLSVWWGDWDDNGTPDDGHDDTITPIALWRVRQITGGSPIAGTVDDNGDGKPEVNRPEEILAYITAMKGDDSYGVPVATRPVLVKGGRVWFEVPGGGDVDSFDYHAEGVHTESSHPFSVNHNVLPTDQALGATGCIECHYGFAERPSPVFDRLIPISPFDETEDARPKYKTVRQMTFLSPF
ncbi:MAG: hypothetical protein QNJ90_00650 [Planctomycetota bacterium]|nr:hypothetical protein [Planctomycetota bacterium]